MVTSLSNTSFTVNWIISDPNCNYTVTWTNLNTGVMDSYTVAENTNSYNVTGLSDNDNYNVTITAVGVCRIITSDPVTVYGECVYVYNVSLYIIFEGKYPWFLRFSFIHRRFPVCTTEILLFYLAT